MRGVSLAPAAPLQDLGPLILGDHPLDLEQQVILRRLAQRAVEEHDLDAGTPELVDEQHLIGIAPGQPIRGVNVEAVDEARGDGIAKALQAGSLQGGAAVAIIDEAMVWRNLQPILGEAGLQRGDLAGNRAALGLMLGGNARVDGSVTE